MSSIYIAVLATKDPGLGDDAAFVIGAFSDPGIAKHACQIDAEHTVNRSLPPIRWHRSDNGTAYWTGETPYGYQIIRTGLDAHAGPRPRDYAEANR